MSAIATTLRGIFGRVLRIEPRDIDIETPFLELGADSLALVEALRGIQEAYGIKLTIRQLFEQLPSISVLAGFLEANGAAAKAAQPQAVPPQAVKPVAEEETLITPALFSQPPPRPPGEEGVVGVEKLVGGSAVERVLSMQIQAFNQLVAQQLQALGARGSAGRSPAPVPAAVPVVQAPPPAPAPIAKPVLPTHLGKVRAGAEMTERQRAHLDALVARYTRKTAKSKEIAEAYRPWLADSRSTVGFRPATKEMLYPLARHRSRGSRLWDVDGNEYVDVTMGMGVHLFGHDPEFLRETISRQVAEGFELGPRSAHSGEVAALFCELTGMERATFTNSGTEACMTAIRLARARTGRTKIVMFAGSYHGHSDATLAQTQEIDGELRSFPVAPGVPPKVAGDVLVLDYGSPQSLEIIRKYRHELAAVFVEPIQSRRPEIQPRDFLHELRRVTAESGIALIFDEMICGFRLHLAGAQGYFGVRADIATYGKVVGGGLPIGVVAGSADYMDGIDGGPWRYGDDSRPERETTFFGGTFCQHPLAMAAAKTVLTYLKDQGPGLQETLNARTARFAERLNEGFTSAGAPIRTIHAHSLFRFQSTANLDLLYYHLVDKGVYVWEWRNCFLSTAHTDADLDLVVRAMGESVAELQRGGFLPEPPAGGPGGKPESALGFWDRQGKPAIAPATTERVGGTTETTVKGNQEVRFGLYFFGNYAAEFASSKYDLIFDCARFADRAGFASLWFPERHFHPFGGLSPNPSVLGAALARETERIALRAGSVVLPLHHPVRVAEEWSLVDNLSGGRVGLSCASGWHPNDFALAPEAFGPHRELMFERLETVQRLWRGEAVRLRDGAGSEVDLRVFPLPARRDLPVWITIVNNPDTYRRAGEIGAGVLTNLMGQTVETLAASIRIYREALAAAGHPPSAGHVAVLLHTFVGPDAPAAVETTRRPFYRYLESSVGLLKTMIASEGLAVDLESLAPEDLEYMLGLAYQRYVGTSALIGSPESCAPIVERMREIGVDEIACLVDFGVDREAVVASLPWLDVLRRQGAAPGAVQAEAVDLPLTEAQEDLYTVVQLGEAASVAYNEPGTLGLHGPLDLTLLRKALQQVVDRHEALRTLLPPPGLSGEPVQRVLPGLSLAVPLVDVSGLPPERREEAACLWAEAEGRRPFDFARGPLIRASVLRLEAREHRLFLAVHHLMADGLSVVVILTDMLAIYEAERAGRAAALPAPMQLRDYVAWTRRERDFAADEAWWREVFSGPSGALPVFEPPTDRPRPPERTFRGAGAMAELPPELRRAVHQLGRRRGATFFITLLTAWSALLHRWTGQDDVVIGVPTARRPLEGGDRLVGHCVDLVPIRSQIGAEGETFASHLIAMRNRIFGAHDHGEYPFARLVRALNPPRDLSRGPLVNVLFNLDQDLDLTRAGGLEIAGRSSGVHGVKLDLAVHALERGEGLRLDLEYGTDLFDAGTMHRLLGHFRTLLEGAAADPDGSLAALPLLSAAERRQLVEWESAPPPDAVPDLVAAVEAMAAQQPDVLAVRGCPGQRDLSYGELVERAWRLAHHLRSLGAGPEARIAICLDRSPEMLVAVLGTLAAGAAYIPLDPGYPAERLAVMLGDAAPTVILTRHNLADALPPSGAQALWIEGLETFEELPEPTGPLPTAPSESLAYVLYTSGSTGRPKGVAMSRGALANLIAWQGREMPEPRRTLQFASLSFDVSFQETFSAWTTGGTLVLIDEDERRDPVEVCRRIRAEGVERIFLPFVALQQLAEAAREEEPLTSLMEIVTAGEQLRVTPALVETFGRLRLYNHYGPTETHVVTAHPLGADPAEWPPLPPIGRPIAGTGAVVVDREAQPVPVGVAGELFLGGAALARGYLGRPDLTAERFVPDPFAAEPGARFYRSGDRARWLPGGDLEFLGRVDNQVKIRGFRVEPGEVEAALAAHWQVREAAVVVRDEGPGDRRLIAYYVGDRVTDHEPLDTRELRAFLAGRLPDYLVPAAFVSVPSLPKTPSGKVDRRALAADRSLRPGEESVAAESESSLLADLLCGHWAAVLGRERVGPHEGFFDLGGHSLLATRLLSRVRDAFGVDLSLRALFELPTPAALARRLDREIRDREGMGAAPPVPLVPLRQERAPLSFAQERLWFFDRLTPGSIVYNMPLAVRIAGGSLRPDALAAALEEIVRRHDALRTVFETVSAEADESDLDPQQVVRPFAGLALPRVDLSGLPASQAKAEAGRIEWEEGRRPFDLAAGPLLRPFLLHLAGDSHILLLAIHHIVVDGWSLGVLGRELAALYRAAASEEALSPLPPLPVQVPDFAVWQRRWLQGEALESLLAAWRQRLTGHPGVLGLPTDRPRPAEQTFGGAVIPLPLTADEGRELLEGLRSLGRRQGATPFMIALAVFQALLQRYSGQDDLLVGMPIAQRTRSELEGLIGFFVNTLPVRTDLGGGPTFLGLLGRVREATLWAYTHQDLPFEKMVEALAPDRGLSRNPLVQATLAFQNTPPPHRELAPGLVATLECIDGGISSFDLTAFLETGGGFAGGFEYAADLFDEATIRRMAGHFLNLLRSALAAPDTALSELSLLIPEEERQIAGAWNLEAELAVAAAAFEAPRTPVEQIVAGAWSEVLGCERVGRRDDFFHLGGHSLLASRVLSRLRGPLGVSLPLRDFFREPTVAGLARRAEQARRTRYGEGPPPLVRVAGDGPIRLSFGQERLWLVDQLQPGSTTYNLALPLVLTGRLDARSLGRALEEIARRHEVLRTRFGILPGAEGGPVQIVEPVSWLGLDPLAQVDLSSLSPETAHAELRRLATRLQPFDLARGPLFRASLARVTEDEHALLVEMHHSICDGWSLDVMTRELSALYGAFSAGRRSPLSELPVQYADFARWQRRWLAGEVVKAELDWWKTRIGENPPPLALPTDRPRLALPPGGGLRGESRTLVLPPELADGLAALARGRGASLFIVLLAGFQALLHRHTHQPKIAVGSPVAGRTRLEVEELIGLFVNTLVLAADFADVDGEPAPLTGGAFLDRARDSTLGAFDHQDLPFEQLVAALARDRDPSRTPLFQAMFVLQNNAQSEIDLPGLNLAVLPGSSGLTLFELTLSAMETDEGIACGLSYAAELFDPATGVRLLEQYRRLLEALVEDASQPVDRLPLLTPAERHQLAVEWPSALGQPSPVLYKGELVPAGAWGEEGRFRADGRFERRVETMAETPDPAKETLAEARRAELDRRRTEVASRRGQLSGDRRALLSKWVGGAAAIPARREEAPPPVEVTPLVKLQTSGSRQPIFLVHAAGGLVHDFVNLAQRLDPDQPFYALQSPALAGGQHFATVPEMAAHYLEAVRSVQPRGPYRLGGYCIGGAVAFEMARQLRAAGEEAGSLLLFDSPGPSTEPPHPLDEAEMLASFARGYGNAAEVSPDDLRALPPEEWIDHVLDRVRETGGLDPSFDAAQLHRRWEVMKRNTRAILPYVPAGRLPLGAILFRAVEQPEPYRNQPFLGWERWLEGPIEVVDVKGGHLDIFLEPAIEAVARGLQDRTAVGAAV
ncbi:MAG TPA: MupA/Atu3671 family FMN-dependent luciferase-like monooxygenase [Thermoanaerobaculia bacterium]|jgi:natural product biosynthesis luciferase-like monooxygenase protein/amino acid adenylation domain-containing protein|nr:MupA/Atu3671 family FMN-dependent luciferase-like monooxygenase [Thermoanaerobaculia bacterium]